MIPTDKRKLFDDANRINTKISAAIDGEDAYTTMYALIALAAHCTKEAGVAPEDAVALLRRSFEPPVSRIQETLADVSRRLREQLTPAEKTVLATRYVDHAYLSAGDNPHADGDRAYSGCSLCGRPRKEHEK